jgi:hypothetical protein
MLSYHVQPVAATAAMADDDEPEDGEIMSMDGEDVEDEVLECSSVCDATGRKHKNGVIGVV